MCNIICVTCLKYSKIPLNEKKNDDFHGDGRTKKYGVKFYKMKRCQQVLEDEKMCMMEIYKNVTLLNATELYIFQQW